MRCFMVGDEMWSVSAVIPMPNAMVEPTLKRGWLSFESTRQSRRLAPIPPGWQFASEKELAEFLEVAEGFRARNRASLSLAR